jgi:hypothetical protein
MILEQQEMFDNRIGLLVPKVRALSAVFVSEEPTHRTHDPETSRRAGEAHPVKRGTDRGTALLIHAAHPGGLTDFELAALMRRQQTSAGKRRLELMRASPAYVEETDQIRNAPSGSPAKVYRITRDGAAMARMIET